MYSFHLLEQVVALVLVCVTEDSRENRCNWGSSYMWPSLIVFTVSTQVPWHRKARLKSHQVGNAFPAERMPLE